MCIELGLIRRVYPTDKQTNILILLIYIDYYYEDCSMEILTPTITMRYTAALLVI